MTGADHMKERRSKECVNMPSRVPKGESPQLSVQEGSCITYGPSRHHWAKGDSKQSCLLLCTEILGLVGTSW